MSDKVILQEQLFAKYKTEVSLRQKCVEEWIVLANNLVLDVLEDCTYVREGEDVVSAFVLDCLVCPIVESKIFHRWHSG